MKVQSKSTFDEETTKLLMGIQYSLPLTTTPLVDLADELGLKSEFVMKKVKEFYGNVIKRYGANLNYRAFSKQQRAALIAARVDESRIKEVAKVINSYNPKHNYWRDDYYNVWFTLKAKDVDSVKALAEEVMEKCGVEEYIILPTKRVYKMDVKYDLIRGISWSEKSEEKFDVPKVEELGLDANLLRKLEKLRVTERPFSNLGYSEEELVDLIKELIDMGVVRDFSGVLKERLAGFKENGMNVVKTEEPEKVSKKLAKRPEITHLVEREVPENWQYPVYFMVHAVKREYIERVRRDVEKMSGVEEIRVLYSIMDLKYS